MTCARCGTDRREAHWSQRLGAHVCAGCYFASFTDAERDEGERLDRQSAIARTIRDAAKRVDEAKGERLRDAALLIEVASLEQDVIELIAEVERLGVHLEVRQ